MLLGYAMREERSIWQDTIGFDSTYGLQGQLIGNLSQFIEQLYYGNNNYLANIVRLSGDNIYIL